jgi:hypothetical protein
VRYHIEAFHAHDESRPVWNVDRVQKFRCESRYCGECGMNTTRIVAEDEDREEGQGWLRRGEPSCRNVYCAEAVASAGPVACFGNRLLTASPTLDASSLALTTIFFPPLTLVSKSVLFPSLLPVAVLRELVCGRHSCQTKHEACRLCLPQ